MTTARIYKPAKTAMQSGAAKTKQWVIDYEPEQPREIEPLMGWTSSGDMRQQVRLRFDTAEEAVAYCERHGIAYQVFEAKPASRRTISYSDNFAFKRRDAWRLLRLSASGGLGRRRAGAAATGIVLPASAGRAGSPDRDRSPCW
jgi:NADH dehydrogenase ubiquinone Fe-S protein 4